MTESVSSTLRDDILVSVCVHDFTPTADSVDAVNRLSQSLAGTFRYWELLVSASSDSSPDWYAALQRFASLRILRLRVGVGPYERRAILAAEAIGDVVALASVEEIDFLDLRQMILDSHCQNLLVIGDRGKSTLVDKMVGIVGNSTGFRVNARFMQTIVCPRALLTRLLDQPERQLALRFPPRDRAIPIEIQVAKREFLTRARRRGLRGRLHLAQKLIVSSAPNVLLALSLASATILVGGAAFILYVLCIWSFKEVIEPGWVTTSGILGLTAAFLGLLGLGMSTGMQKMIDLLGNEDNDEVLEEIGKVNVYAGISADLNIQYEPGSTAEAMAKRAEYLDDPA
ncbi:hypothetical protein [Paracoccus zhejiangensis]|uniref:hypothetical protein n=1 Tax=Paracoccus zhejiangensis TaxID=1077935 RepID=UPI0013000E23|nr:hypothetical protein [Paracoccus zhejiangensis]